MAELTSLDQVRLPADFILVSPGARKTPRHRAGKFLKGPVPWTWVLLANRVSPRAWQVGTALWFLQGVSQGKNPVVLSPKVLRELGMKRGTTYRALVALEKAGLVMVSRRRGRSPRVTILEASDVALLDR